MVRETEESTSHVGEFPAKISTKLGKYLVGLGCGDKERKFGPPEEEEEGGIM